MTKPDALDLQVGGSHYKRGIQPFALSLANNHDGCIHAICKYMTRHSRKDPAKGYEDCQKAHHIVGIRVSLLRIYGTSPNSRAPQIKIQDYISANELGSEDAGAIYALEAWHERANVDHLAWSEHVRKRIRIAARTAYPNLYNEKDFV